jgi:hypothetical protein
MYEIVGTNVGGGVAATPIVVTDTFPAGITPIEAQVRTSRAEFGSCEIVSQTVSCPSPNRLRPGELVEASIAVEVSSLPDPTVVSDTATLSGGGAATVQATARTTITSAPASFALLPGPAGLGGSITEADGSPDTQAGSHPNQVTLDFGVPDVRIGEWLGSVDGGLRDLHSYLPRGFVVNPNATSVRCLEAQLEANECPDGSQVGLATTMVTFLGIAGSPVPIFNMVPPADAPADFAFNVSGASIYVHILGGVRPGDYAISSEANDVLSNWRYQLVASQIQLWNDPSNPRYNFVRGSCGFGYGSGECHTEHTGTPLLTMPSACSSALTLEASVDSWQDPGNFVTRSTSLTDANGNPTRVSGCDKLDFSPSMSVAPDASVADSPSGLRVHLHIPQNENFNSLAEANLKDVTVTLPAGMTLSPSIASGLSACTEQEIGLGNKDEPTCPEASKIGTVEVVSPLLTSPLLGSVYVAQQNANPFHSTFAIYVTAATSGTIIKLAGKIEPDPATGQLKTTFLENPELPFSDMELDFFNGSRAALATPQACGTYQTHYALAPWSGTPAVTGDAPMTIDRGCSGGFAPSITTGTVSSQAGAFSPFVLSFSRNDGEQHFAGLQETLPPGLLAKLAGVPQCSDADANAGACSEASRIGSVTVGSGVGPSPYYLKGKVYLTGAYNGGPFGEVVVVPAVAGPFNLGNVVIRGSIRVDSSTAQATAISDPFPQFVGQTGVPADVRRIDVTLDRPGFTFNPTNCKELHAAGALTASNGASAPINGRYQATNCSKLAFKPKFTVSTSGKTSRAKGASLKAALTYPAGSEANMRSVKVTLPRALPSRLTTLQKSCADKVFSVNPAACPAASRVGSATVSTPVLASKLTGPVYFVSHGAAKFPDLVIVLQGEGITVQLDGETFISKSSVTTTTFRSVPDVPFSSFSLTLPSGPNSALGANGNFCKQKLVMPTALTAQNGAVIHQSTKIAVSGCPKQKKRR